MLRQPAASSGRAPRSRVTSPGRSAKSVGALDSPSPSKRPKAPPTSGRSAASPTGAASRAAVGRPERQGSRPQTSTKASPGGPGDSEVRTPANKVALLQEENAALRKQLQDAQDHAAAFGTLEKAHKKLEEREAALALGERQMQHQRAAVEEILQVHAAQRGKLNAMESLVKVVLSRLQTCAKACMAADESISIGEYGSGVEDASPKRLAVAQFASQPVPATHHQMVASPLQDLVHHKMRPAMLRMMAVRAFDQPVPQAQHVVFPPPGFIMQSHHPLQQHGRQGDVRRGSPGLVRAQTPQPAMPRLRSPRVAGDQSPSLGQRWNLASGILSGRGSPVAHSRGLVQIVPRSGLSGREGAQSPKGWPAFSANSKPSPKASFPVPEPESGKAD
mmetsp:Transcript_46660/g.101403  ORF Transcript_46660/g.101403 Transcript_46660/m.101403 type:complete len:390 (+) Transcript_46660:21-1190(+)